MDERDVRSIYREESRLRDKDDRHVSAREYMTADKTRPKGRQPSEHQKRPGRGQSDRSMICIDSISYL